MGTADWLPVVSQAKTMLQLVRGDVDGAKKTIETFLKECPGVSQATSTVQLMRGDLSGALDTQKRFGKELVRVTDWIPGSGYAKGIVNYVYEYTGTQGRQQNVNDMIGPYAGPGVVVPPSVPAALPPQVTPAKTPVTAK